MSGIRFIESNPFVREYANTVTTFGQEDRAAQRAVQERETWMRAENDRQEIAKALDRAQATMQPPAAAGPSGPQPPVPAQMPEPNPGVSGAPVATPAAMPSPAGIRGVSATPPVTMPNPAGMLSSTPVAQPPAPAVTVGGGASPQSASLRMVSAMGNHPAMNQTRMAGLTGAAQSQDQRQAEEARHQRGRADKLADQVHALATSNDPTKLAYARQLATQAGMKIPERYWTDAKLRADIDLRLKAMKDQGVHAWDIAKYLKSQPGMDQTPGGQVALQAADLKSPVKPLQGGGHYETRPGPDGKPTQVWVGGSYFGIDDRGNARQITDEDGKAVVSRMEAAGRPAGMGGGAGGESKQIQFAKWRTETLRAAGMAEADIARIVAGGTGVNRPMSQNEVMRAANSLMKTKVDAMGRPTMTLQQAIGEVRAATSGQEPAAAQPGAPSVTPQPGARPTASPNGGAGTRPTSDRMAIWQDELARERALKVDPDDTANVQRRQSNIDSLSREIQAAGGTVPAETVGGGASPAAAQAPAQATAQPPANTGRVTPKLVDWAKSSKSKGVNARAVLAELKRQGYSKEEALDAARQGGY